MEIDIPVVLSKALLALVGLHHSKYDQVVHFLKVLARSIPRWLKDAIFRRPTLIYRIAVGKGL